MDTRHPLFLYLIIASVCFFSFFIHNDTLPADLMESRNLATAQEMVSTGNYLVPTMNGELRLEKPPLPTWIAAGIEHISPYNLPAQRTATGAAATVMVFFLFLTVRRLTKKNSLAFISALVLATCLNPILMGRTATWDIYCHAFMLGAIYFMVCAFDSKGKQWGRFVTAGIFMGLSFLSKGPVSFYALLLPFLAGYIATCRPSVKGKKAPVIVMLAVTLAVSFWWPAYIAVFHPGIGSAVAAKESGAWLNRSVRPVWYYWKFPAEAGIWAIFWVTSLLYFVFKNRPEQRNIFRMSVIWTVVAFILLSLIPEKKSRYLLPMLIPGAVNIAFYLWYGMKSALSKNEKSVLRLNGIIIAVISLLMPVATYFILIKEGHGNHIIFGISSSVFLAISIYIFVGLYGRRGISATKVFYGTVLTMTCAMAFCYGPVTRLFVNENRHSISELRNVKEIKELPFYQPENEFIRMELVYETGKPIAHIDTKNDSLVYSRLPFVLISVQPAPALLEGLDISAEYIGTFDNNWRKTDSKRHNKNLVKEVYVIRSNK